MKNSTEQSKRRGFLSKMLVAGAGGIAFLSSSAYAKDGKKKTVELTEEQLDELYFIYQEEKLARDVYITLGEMYPNENTFASIQLSEQRHIDAAQGLCETYNIDLSNVNEDEVGTFDNDILQELYTTLVSKGSDSLTLALEQGVFIEELDIEDLTKAIDEMDMPDDVIRVYENLREGSYNHLESFQGALTLV
ncbi:Uncharacterized protein MJ0754 [hydrothermal vent metagenome]|uniref:Uncharacterized protein MJ0754 n=1 Tax=hydrothermal vent metagenome TaxID=652676 RepID=A0A1W1ECQ6_9ZZZZ